MNAARRDGLAIHQRTDAGWEPTLDAELTGHLRRHRNALIATTGADGAPADTRLVPLGRPGVARERARLDRQGRQHPPRAAHRDLRR
jgi:hypothetical protein